MSRFTDIYRRDGREALTAAVNDFSAAGKAAILAALKAVPPPVEKSGKD